jgi:hypothetical protein
MHDNAIKLSLLGLIGLSVSLLFPQSFGQNTDNLTNLTNLLFDDFYPMVMVEYESDSIVVLRSDENIILPLNGTLAPLWNAIDIVKKEGKFEFKQLISTELTIDENLTMTDPDLLPNHVFYVIMTK